MHAFFGGLLMAVGGLIAALSGLCSGVFIVGSIISMASSNPSDFFNGLPLVLLFGGLPFLVGLALFFMGRAIYRRRDQQSAQPPGDGPINPV